MLVLIAMLTMFGLIAMPRMIGQPRLAPDKGDEGGAAATTEEADSGEEAADETEEDSGSDDVDEDAIGDDDDDTSAVDDNLRARAKGYGFSDEDINGFGSDDAIKRHLSAMDRRLINLNTNATGNGTAASSAATGTPPASPDAKAGESGAAYQFKHLKPEDVDPGLIAELSEMANLFRRDISAANERAGKAEERATQAEKKLELTESARIERDMLAQQKRYVEKYPGLKEKLGTTSYSRLKQHDPRRGEIEKIVTGIFTLQNNLAQIGAEVPDFDEAFERVVIANHPELIAETERKKIGDSMTKRRSMTVGVPGTSGSRSTPNAEKGRDAVAAEMQRIARRGGLIS